MTHWMRTMHDAILVGVGTALNDDPQLNTRHLPPSAHPYHLPRPVILDTHLRLKSTCKLLLNYQQGRGRRPWVICAEPKEASEWNERSAVLQKAGARVIPIPMDPEDGLLSIPSLIKKLGELDVRSLMVEGGARIIQSFLAKAVIDTIIITTAPKVVGEEGISHGMQFELEREIPGFNLVAQEKIGDDDVIVWTRREDK